MPVNIITLRSFVKNTVIAIIISSIIGTLFLMFFTQCESFIFVDYLINAGYSSVLGLGLFANGLVFSVVEKRFISWIEFPVRSIIIAVIVHLVYSSFIIFFINWLWYVVILNDAETISEIKGGWYVIFGEYLILVVISLILYIRSFFRAYRNEVINSEQLKQDAIALQYQIMQNQVNPHFLFNSLNVLGSLIDIDREKAKLFTRELSLFYRELLHFKDKELVSLIDELQFVKRYIFLQKIRFGDNFNVQILLSEAIKGEVIPMSLQMLVENAVKHNIVSKDKPLNVLIGKLDGDEIFVENNRQAKQVVDGSNQIGLKNIQKRYEYLTGKKMIIFDNSDYYRVTIPLVIF